jgi:hypothetical protein
MDGEVIGGGQGARPRVECKSLGVGLRLRLGGQGGEERDEDEAGHGAVSRTGGRVGYGSRHTPVNSAGRGVTIRKS